MRQLGSLNLGSQNTEQVGAAAAVLAKYIKDTGDQEGVVEFLQFMVKSGKVGSHFLYQPGCVLNKCHLFMATYCTVTYRVQPLRYLYQQKLSLLVWVLV